MDVRQAVLNSGLGAFRKTRITLLVSPLKLGAATCVRPRSRLGDVFISTQGSYLGDPEKQCTI